MGDVLRDVLSERYRSLYDKAQRKHEQEGLCPTCARKVAISEVLAVAVRVSEVQRKHEVQLAEHGVVVVDHDGAMPCFR